MVNTIDLSGISAAQNFLNGTTGPLTSSQAASFESNGFLVPSTPQADGSGLPFTQIPAEVPGQIVRNIITWYVPQFGTVRMFINPQHINYKHNKLINADRTKGGYTLQYWGEELSVLTLNGTTGSSGIEGINALYEIYRAEQYAFDAVGLTLAANNAAADVSNSLIQNVGGALGNGVNQLFGGSPNSPTAAAGGAGLLGGLGMDSPQNYLSAANIPSLASLAFAVEMFYNGWVYRGYFKEMSIDEQADNFLINYNITFMVTQRRGYRTNYFPWASSANNGPSSYTVPRSFNGVITNPATIINSPLITPTLANSNAIAGNGGFLRIPFSR